MKYLTTLESQNQVDVMLQTLEDIRKVNKWESHQHSLLEGIDRRFTAALLKAELACARPNTASWSPEVHKAYLVYSYWRKIVSATATKVTIQDQIPNIKQQLGDDEVLYFGDRLRSPKRQLYKARRALHEVRKDAVLKRQEHLTLQYEIQVQANKMKKARAIKIIGRAERRTRVFTSACRKLTKPRSSGGLSYVLVPKSGGTDENGNPIIHYERIHNGRTGSNSI
jgi:hypothetical protein